MSGISTKRFREKKASITFVMVGDTVCSCGESTGFAEIGENGEKKPICIVCIERKLNE